LTLIGLWLIVLLGLVIAIHSYGYVDNAREADVLIVLGAGLRPNNTPSATLRTRAVKAADLWAEGMASHVICTGAVPRRATISEAEGCRRVLLDENVPDSVIILEERSRSTEENAIYASEIMAERGWKSAVIVSSRYHLLRANWLFNRSGIEIYTSPATVSFMTIRQYISQVSREIVALHWQAFSDLLNLPFTSVPFG
jgi:uncharacterized SAM-binding protein YcdF (DUF218 family)